MRCSRERGVWERHSRLIAFKTLVREEHRAKRDAFNESRTRSSEEHIPLLIVAKALQSK